MYSLNYAKMEDLKESYEIIQKAKEFQKQQGFTQWTDDYPNELTIIDDIENKKGFVLKVDKKIAGYMCIDFTGEPAYEKIDGAWSEDLPYAVIHRMAFSDKFVGKGLSSITFKLIEEFCLSNGINYIRVDTDFENKRMQHVLEKNNFVKCGVVVFQGSGKVAYDKKLNA